MTDAVTRSVRLPAVPETVDEVGALLAEVWDEAPWTPAGDRFRLELAVTEVVGNVVEHAYAHVSEEGSAPDHSLTLALDVDHERLRAVVEDDGQAAAVDLSDLSMPDAEAESGRGLPIALASVDELSYARTETRNTWTLTCRITS
ncbi:ATP-binding protein [Nocardioides bruguierae]|uniref:ATP-binding protein n=1 Tax=Nocardioides bruguierae TaxID=2945102 RepID=A0A9X2D440_9ACTN|nr:ATP-binding protein [Nocardioides bruguierae]MCL8024390.1 ATP-binding protein [Nocardioides bruguierae]MCM0618858.1 ATP-binding protein [Nocardioides bruguierae]